MAFTPISNTAPQYEENDIAASGYYIKFYESGTTTPLAMATDSTGDTLLDKCQLDSEGYPINGSGAAFIPHVDSKYKIVLFRNEDDADNNNLSNAAWDIDKLSPVATDSRIGTDFDQVPLNTNIVYPVATVADLRLLEPTVGGQKVLADAYSAESSAFTNKGGGIFTAKYGDYSDSVSNDEFGGVYIPFSSDETGATGAWVRNVEQDVMAEWFGWNDSSNEAGEVLNAATLISSLLGIGKVTYSSPKLNQTTSILVRGGVVVKGSGAWESSEIRVADGATLDAQFKTESFTTALSTKPSNADSSLVSIDGGFDDVWFNGNRYNRAAATSWDDGTGGQCYWIRPVLKNVLISKQPGIGMISALYGNSTDFWTGTNMERDRRDKGIDGVYIYDCGYEGLIWEGPSDVDVGSIYVGWCAGVASDYRDSITPSYNSAAKSKYFTTGGIRAVEITNGGSGYTSATATVSGGSGSGAELSVYVNDSGQVAGIYIVNEGDDYDRDTVSLTISGDGSGASADIYVMDSIDSVVINNNGAEFGFIHAFNNPDGYGINIRSSGQSGRVNAEFLVAESSLGCIHIGNPMRYEIGRVDTRNNQLHGGPLCFADITTRSLPGGVIATHNILGNSSDTNVSPRIEIGGQDAVFGAGKIRPQGTVGDGVVITSNNASINTHIEGMTGAAIVTTDLATNCRVDASIDACSKAWRNEAQALAGNIKISSSAYSSDISTHFDGVDDLQYDEWKTINIVVSDRDNVLTKKRSSGSWSAVADTSLTTTQTIVIAHDLMRTPNLSEIIVNVRHTSASIATAQPAMYRAVSSSNSDITVQVKFNTAGTGNASVLVSV